MYASKAYCNEVTFNDCLLCVILSFVSKYKLLFLAKKIVALSRETFTFADEYIPDSDADAEYIAKANTSDNLSKYLEYNEDEEGNEDSVSVSDRSVLTYGTNATSNTRSTSRGGRYVCPFIHCV